MAKELPYFKFEPNQWENGNIQIFSHELKGVFIDLCSMYWSRLGDLPYKLAVGKICNGNATALDSLCDENVFTIIDGFICIDFLNEQLGEFDNLRKINSENARNGWDKRRINATAKRPQSDRNAIREDKIIEDNRRKDKNKDIPAFLDFLNYGLEKEKNLCEKGLKLKYESWVINDWKDGNQKKIVNWKSKLLNTIQYLPKKQTANQSNPII